jgi:signal transduction histidine kinase
MVSLLAIGLGSALIIYYDIKTFKKDMVDSTDTLANFLAETCQAPLAFDRGDELKEELDQLKGLPFIENACVYNEGGDIFAVYEKHPGGFIPPAMQESASSKFKGDYLHVFLPIQGKNKRYGTLYLRASTTLLDQKINDYLKTMGLGLIGLILLTYLLAARFQRGISQPILRLAEVTDHITRDADYSVRVKKQGTDEIGTLYNGFNNMLEQIHLREKQRDEAEAEQMRLMVELEEKNKELEQVVYVTSHDLRSPLVNIQGFSKELGFSLKEFASLLETENLPPDVKKKFSLILEEDIPDSLKYILSSTTKMDNLLSGLLKLSRVGRTTATFGNIDMNELIIEMQQAFEFQLKEAGVELKVDDLPPCFGNDTQINQMFSNLLNNALKYLDPKRPGKIHISGCQDRDRVIYCVTDNGIGIPKEHQKKVFQIFHRLNPEDTEGEGLGLTIVNKIVSRHGGKIWIQSEPGMGSSFFISLPSIKIKPKKEKINPPPVQ